MNHLTNLTCMTRALITYGFGAVNVTIAKDTSVSDHSIDISNKIYIQVPINLTDCPYILWFIDENKHTAMFEHQDPYKVAKQLQNLMR